MSHRKETEAMAPQPIEDWTRIPWRKLERSVYRLQKRIYQASDRGNDKAVHNLQRLLMKSQAARTLAVRKVTQDNQGKRTAGIDGIKSVEPAQRLVMVQRLRHHKPIKPQPTRRVWIPKPGKTERRPLGIPIKAAHYLSLQAMFGIPCVLLLVDQNLRSTFIDLLYHVFALRASSATLPMSLSRLA
jgi:RNA-directed DNA polymerase